ncbi:PREDICTED: uncharacterized protein LOC109210804 [Nicotiana attenuata]|uniref:uncharacterized protein LOC109210804 n=1 Tax=Nicotiana attenuata TaxID=49451 RepID=UPI00090550E1|nr:PREDICTED: uncharacterized protein LOC109210804 [Nicotiana attenuata]
MAEYDEENPFVDIDEYIEDTNAIVPPRVDVATFKVEHGLILMLKAKGFFRNSTDDPTQYFRNFLGVCAMHKQNNVSDDALRLRVFKYSLDGEARKWIQNLPPNSSHSWPELVQAFLAKWFPQSKKSELRDKIFFFKQLPGEHLHEAWDRFKLYLVRPPNHAKNAADGSFMDETFARITQILDKMAIHNQAWHSEDTTGGIVYGIPSLTNMIKENQERDQVIAGLATNVNVLTKMFTESQIKKRKPYQVSGQQNQWRPNPQGQCNQQWRNDQGSSNQGNWSNNNKNFSTRSSKPYVPPKGKYSNSPHWNEGFSSDSKLENMLERVLQNKERSDTSMGNMTELMGSYTASIQNLEMQMRDLSREKSPKQKGTLPSDTIANPKGSGSSTTSHYMAITTRSGKILQREIEQVVEVEDSELEVEAQVEVPIVVEA